MSQPGAREIPSTLEQFSTHELLSTLRREAPELIFTLNATIRDVGQNLSAEDLHDLERLKALVEEISRRKE